MKIPKTREEYKTGYGAQVKPEGESRPYERAERTGPIAHEDVASKSKPYETPRPSIAPAKDAESKKSLIGELISAFYAKRKKRADTRAKLKGNSKTEEYPKNSNTQNLPVSSKYYASSSARSPQKPKGLFDTLVDLASVNPAREESSRREGSANPSGYDASTGYKKPEASEVTLDDAIKYFKKMQTAEQEWGQRKAQFRLGRIQPKPSPAQLETWGNTLVLETRVTDDGSREGLIVLPISGALYRYSVRKGKGRPIDVDSNEPGGSN